LSEKGFPAKSRLSEDILMAYEREAACALGAVREAAVLCQAVRGRLLGPGTLAKTDASPVTVADFGSQALICRALAEAFPNDPVIAEEDSAELRRPEHAAVLAEVLAAVGGLRPGAGAAEVCGWIDHGGAGSYSERFWTLDPIDGTKGFLRAEQYAVSLALVVGGQIVLGATACPNLPASGGGPRGSVFLAVRGQGARELSLADDGGSGTPIRVSPADDPAGARFCESVEAAHSAHGDAARVAQRLGIAGAPVRLDSQAKYAVVARGEAEIYLRLPTRADYREKIWDHAGGVLILEEAGGRVTDVAGRPLEFTHGRELTANRGVIATNGRLHDRVLEALGSAP
jgi:3'(2'), 5'-bisphosphate nucleotidase